VFCYLLIIGVISADDTCVNHAIIAALHCWNFLYIQKMAI